MITNMIKIAIIMMIMVFVTMTFTKSVSDLNIMINSFSSSLPSTLSLFQTCICIWKHGKETVECINRWEGYQINYIARSQGAHLGNLTSVSMPLESFQIVELLTSGTSVQYLTRLNRLPKFWTLEATTSKSSETTALFRF